MDNRYAQKKEEKRRKKEKKTKVEKRVSYTYLLFPTQIPNKRSNNTRAIKREQFCFRFQFSARFPSKCEKRLFNSTSNRFCGVFFFHRIFCLICVYAFQLNNNKYTYIFRHIFLTTFCCCCCYFIHCMDSQQFFFSSSFYLKVNFLISILLLQIFRLFFCLRFIQITRAETI